MKINVKLILTAAVALGAVAFASAVEYDEIVVATDKATFWLGGDAAEKARVVSTFWMAPDEFEMAKHGRRFKFMPPWSRWIGFDVYAYTNAVGCLTVFGEGDAFVFPDDLDRGAIRDVVVEDGVASVEDGFFMNCSGLATFTGGADFVSFGEWALYFCPSLETITLKNPAALESLADAVVYRAAIDDGGRPYAIPRISVDGYNEILYGKENLTDAEWTRIGPLGPAMEDTGYHFFRVRLEK